MRKLVVLLFASGLFACAQPEAAIVEQVDTPVEDSYVGPESVFLGDGLTLSGGYVFGDLDDAEGLDNQATTLYGYTDDDVARLEILVERDDDAVMLFLTFEGGGLNSESLQTGSSLAFQHNEYEPDSGFFVRATGCVGPYASMWDYDAQADTVELVMIDRLDGSSELHYVATWDGYQGREPDVLAGHFILSR